VLNYTYPLELTNPATIPDVDEDPVYYPASLYPVSNTSAIVSTAINQVLQIVAGSGSNCSKCLSALEIGQYVAQRVPQQVPDLLVSLCEITQFMSNSSCHQNYDAGNFGAVWSQILSLADVSGSDGQYICNYLSSSFCPHPHALPSNTSAYFGPKPKNITIPKPSGERVKVLHMSDMHIDPRYQVASEANCSSGLCCRPSTSSTSSKVTVPAPLYGAYKCDSPYFLLTSALESVGPLTGTTHQNCSDKDQFAWSIYTGDLVSHESQNELSRNYTTYAEWTIYYMLKAYIPSGPIFAVLGNHDSNPGTDSSSGSS